MFSPPPTTNRHPNLQIRTLSVCLSDRFSHDRNKTKSVVSQRHTCNTQYTTADRICRQFRWPQNQIEGMIQDRHWHNAPVFKLRSHRRLAASLCWCWYISQDNNHNNHTSHDSCLSSDPSPSCCCCCFSKGSNDGEEWQARWCKCMLLPPDCSEESWSSTLAAPLAHSLTHSINQSINHIRADHSRPEAEMSVLLHWCAHRRVRRRQ